MRRCVFIVGLIAAGIAMAHGDAAAAGEIHAGSTLQVKANSIWFEEADKLAHWQELKARGDPAAFATHEKEALADRDAWQFTSELTVKVLGYVSGKSRLHVQMATPGRMLGTAWFIDADAVAQ